MKKFKARIIPEKGASFKVKIEARDSIEAKRILKHQYPGSKVTELVKD